MPLVRIDPRPDSHTTSIGPLHITGLTVAGVILIGLVLWFVWRMYRKRAAKKREDSIGVTFPPVRGIDGTAEKHPGSLYAMPNKNISWVHIEPAIVMPEKAIVRRDEQIGGSPFKRHGRLSPKMLPFALGMVGNTTDQGVGNQTSHLRESFLSTGDGKNRISVSSASSNTSRDLTAGSKRKVRQLFSPILPDELLAATLGEQLTIMQSFEDGWCLVGRENSAFTAGSNVLFRRNLESQNNIELGAVPAWCFIKPVKGLRVERPVRNTSLGIAVQFQGPGISSRDEIISWSNL